MIRDNHIHVEIPKPMVHERVVEVPEYHDTVIQGRTLYQG